MEDKIWDILENVRQGYVTVNDGTQQVLDLFAVMRRAEDAIDTNIAFNCNICKIYYRNNVKQGKVVNRCCPACGGELPKMQ